ncbi:hypothetical protein C8R45DRAFT_1033470 [Mycena sanguinolenta]|nr:hypothetical protein C8R45DRAFT_1033470 [Mycena sanguinolenta]
MDYLEPQTLQTVFVQLGVIFYPAKVRRYTLTTSGECFRRPLLGLMVLEPAVPRLMEFVPQELVHAIVHEIDDISSLKACALASSIFRHPSQRILLSSLTLKENAQEAHSLLEESPRVASYVTRLSIRTLFHGIPDPNLQQSFQQVFAKLKNVRQCIMSGTFSTEHRTPFISALVEFLLRQPLRELNVLYWEGVPPTTALRLLTAAPMVSFFSVYVNRDPLLSSDPLQLTPKLEELFVGYGARGIYELLAQPQFKHCTSTLRRLSVDYLHSGSVSPLAQFVPDIQSTSPEFPSLSFIEASLWFRDIATSWFSETISSLANMSPILADISISFFPLNNQDVTHAVVADGVLAALDVAIAAHPGHPLIRWRFDFPAYFDDEGARAGFFAKFTGSVQSGMPRTHGERRIVVEKYTYGPERTRRAGGTDAWVS